MAGFTCEETEREDRRVYTDEKGKIPLGCRGCLPFITRSGFGGSTYHKILESVKEFGESVFALCVAPAGTTFYPLVPKKCPSANENSVAEE
jgi:hypothetical protein